MYFLFLHSFINNTNICSLKLYLLQKKMFYAVILKYSKKKLVVPARNVKDHQHKAMINFKFGIKNVEDYIIFCSPIQKNDPHFGPNENLKEVFDQEEDGYYLANVLRVFGEYVQSYCHHIIWHPDSHTVNIFVFLN
jgi:hypothetical protein